MAHEKFHISRDLCEFLVQSEAQATRSYAEAEIQEQQARIEAQEQEEAK